MSGPNDLVYDPQGEIPFPKPGTPAHRTARVRDVVSEGAERFWSAVAEAYPDVETGDFPPGDTLRLERALTEAVEQWLLYNHPPTRDEADGLARYAPPWRADPQ